jgi:hypothetical protein
MDLSGAADEDGLIVFSSSAPHRCDRCLGLRDERQGVAFPPAFIAAAILAAIGRYCTGHRNVSASYGVKPAPAAVSPRANALSISAR